MELSPPRERVEHTLVDLAAGAPDDMAAIAVLADAVQARRTLPSRVRDVLGADRQVRDGARGPVIRDVVYTALGQVVELDGRLFHDSARARDADLDRDLDAAMSGQATTRLGWGQVFGRPCATAVRIGALLGARGWTGRVRPCPACSGLAA